MTRTPGGGPIVSEPTPSPLEARFLREESGRLVAALARRLGAMHLELAEDAAQDAIAKALHEWRFHGPPQNPSAWLRRVAFHRALDLLRRESMWRRLEGEIAAELGRSYGDGERGDPTGGCAASSSGGDELALLFACCHPALSPDSQVALILKTLGGLSVPEIAAAFLAGERAIAQRLVRAKRALAEARESFGVPADAEFPARLDAVLRALYLVFNEGYRSHGGAPPIRPDLCREAIRLGELLASHPSGNVSRVHALLALFAFQASRLPARVSDDGSLLRLEEQDRSLWDARLVDRAHEHLERAGRGGELTPIHLEAAIASCHASAPSFEATDWRTIADCYDALLERTGSPVVAVNRGVALGLAEGPRRGIEALEALRGSERLRGYFLLPAALGRLYELEGDGARAAACYEEALRGARSDADRRFLEARLARLTSVRGDS